MAGRIAVCWCSVTVLLCWQDCDGDGGAAGGGVKLLWADFGRARVVPGLDRHSPAAQVPPLSGHSNPLLPHVEQCAQAAGMAAPLDVWSAVLPPGCRADSAMAGDAHTCSCSTAC